MKCMLRMSVFSLLRRLQIRKDSLRGDDIDGCFYILFYFYITSSMQSRPLVPRQTWRLTGEHECLSLVLLSTNCVFDPRPHRVFQDPASWWGELGNVSSPTSPCYTPNFLTRDWQGGLFVAPPSRFYAISLKVRNGSSPNFRYPPRNQFRTSWRK